MATQVLIANSTWVEPEGLDDTYPGFGTVVFESLYQVFLALDAGRRKIIIQAFGICLNNASLFIFALLAFFANRKIISDAFLDGVVLEPSVEYRRLLIGLPSSLGILTFVLMVLSWRLLGNSLGKTLCMV